MCRLSCTSPCNKVQKHEQTTHQVNKPKYFKQLYKNGERQKPNHTATTQKNQSDKKPLQISKSTTQTKIKTGKYTKRFNNMEDNIKQNAPDKEKNG